MYVLESQDKEIPSYIEDCACYQESDEYDCLLDCSPQLADEIKNFDDATYIRIVTNDSQDAQKLFQWWEMYKIYIPIDKFEK